MTWIEGAGAAGWVIVALGIVLLVGGIVAALVRVPRGTAILLVLGCQLPVFVGVAGMFMGLSNTDEYMASHPGATAADRATGEEESMRCLWLGLGTMLVCDAAAAVALVRSRKPATPAAA